MSAKKGMTRVPEKIDEATSSLIRELLGQQWHYLVMEGEVEEPDHNCGPDCGCLRGHDEPSGV